MQKYIQIMINTIIVRLPYILDAASAMSRYMENAREKIDQARDEISAPGHWLLKLAFRFGMHLYSTRNRTASTPVVIRVRMPMIEDVTRATIGRCSVSLF